MKKLLILFLLISCFCFGQEREVSGIVKSPAGKVYANTTLFFIPKNAEVKKVFARTDETGSYEVNLKENQEYQVEIYTLSRKIKIPLTVNQNKNQDILVLEDKETAIEEVKIKYVMPITVKGDTTTYNVKSFSNNTEKKLKDVIKKLPGFEVDKNGVVKNNGQVVGTTMVEGNSFFGGNTKLAIENLSASDVKSVQVIQNYNESSIRKKAFDTGIIALNIELNDKNKNLFFGDVNLGTDFHKSYSGHVNSFLFSKKKSFSAIIDVNNRGENTLTEMDILNFSGGIMELINGGSMNSFLNSIDESLYDMVVPNNKISKVNSQFTVINPSFTKENHRINSIILYSRKKQFYKEGYLKNSLDGDYNETSNEEENKTLNNIYANIDYKYNPSLDTEFRNIIRGNYYRQETDDTNIANINGKYVDYLTQNKSENYKVMDKIYFDKRIDEKNSFIGSYKFELSKERNDKNYLSTQPFGFIDAPYKDAHYFLSPWNLKREVKVDLSNVYSYFLGNHRFNADVGLNYNRTIFENDLERKDISNASLFANLINQKMLDSYLGLTYILKVKKFTLTARGKLVNTLFVFNHLEENYPTRFVFLPKLNLKYEWNSSHKVELDYSAYNRYENIKSFAQNYLIQGFNSVYLGGLLSPNYNKTHVLNFNYNRTNGYKKYGYGADITYRYTDTKKLMSLLYNNNAIYYRPVIVDNPLNSINFEVNANKTLRSLNFFTKLNYKIADNAVYRLQKVYQGIGTTYGGKFGVETKWKLPVTVSTYYEFSKSYSKNDLSSYTYRISEYHIDASANLFGVYLAYNNNIEINYSGDVRTRYLLGDIMISYASDTGKEYGFQVSNLYRTKADITNSFTPLFYSSKTIYVLPRTWVLYFKFKF